MKMVSLKNNFKILALRHHNHSLLMLKGRALRRSIYRKGKPQMKHVVAPHTRPVLTGAVPSVAPIYPIVLLAISKGRISHFHHPHHTLPYLSLFTE
jgi:hypothetical protein